MSRNQFSRTLQADWTWKVGKEYVEIDMLLTNEHHLKMKQYICPKCEKSLASSSSLWNHKQRCKKKSEEEVKPIESEIEGLPEAIDAAYTKLVESDGDTSYSESDDSNTKPMGESDDEDENVNSKE